MTHREAQMHLDLLSLCDPGTTGMVRGTLRRALGVTRTSGAGPREALVFRSRKGGGARPASRVTLWRVLSSVGMDFRTLARLARALRGEGVSPPPAFGQDDWHEDDGQVQDDQAQDEQKSPGPASRLRPGETLFDRNRRLLGFA